MDNNYMGCIMCAMRSQVHIADRSWDAETASDVLEITYSHRKGFGRAWRFVAMLAYGAIFLGDNARSPGTTIWQVRDIASGDLIGEIFEEFFENGDLTDQKIRDDLELLSPSAFLKTWFSS